MAEGPQTPDPPSEGPDAGGLIALFTRFHGVVRAASGAVGYLNSQLKTAVTSANEAADSASKASGAYDRLAQSANAAADATARTGSSTTAAGQGWGEGGSQVSKVGTGTGSSVSASDQALIDRYRQQTGATPAEAAAMLAQLRAQAAGSGTSLADLIKMRIGR